MIFFFQAEDGIRDTSVTGVQTCALPISWPRAAPKAAPMPAPRTAPRRVRPRTANSTAPPRRSTRRCRKIRSEERRVGKECRSRWSPCQAKKKKEENQEEKIIDNTRKINN